MSSKVRIRDADFMESQTENESLLARVREIEDENQELRAQNLLLNRSVIEMRNELLLMRMQMNELTDTSSLLRERVRNLIQQQQPQESDVTAGPLTAPPLMPPPNPPPPPPLPPARIRISPRQVGAGEAFMTPLGISLSSAPRHLIKRGSTRQGFYRSVRHPYRRFDIPEPGPSTASSFVTQDRTNYFVGLRIVPHFQTSFICAPSGSSEFSDSASDSSGSDENLQLTIQSRQRIDESSFRKPSSREYDIFKTVRNFHQAKLRSPILQNYNLSLPNTNSKFIFPISSERKNRENPTLPSTSGNQNRVLNSERIAPNGVVQSGNISMKNFSDCVQYTFPAIHEGLHHSGIPSVLAEQPSKPRKFKKNILYFPLGGASCSNLVTITDPREKPCTERSQNNIKVDSESFSSTDEARSRRSSTVEELPSDFDQDGFQADESSNCMTSADNSLEKICLNEPKVEKKS